MKKIGITGQSGFIGTHLYNTLKYQFSDFRNIPFKKTYFDNLLKLNDFVSKCDVIIHLAALNRHDNPKTIYDTNIQLVKLLIESMGATNSRPKIILASSIQERDSNFYGQSKKECSRLLSEWAINNNASFTKLIIPNVFGAFSRPYHNSVVATFCHQLANDEEPEIFNDNSLNLIYIDYLIDFFIDCIKEGNKTDERVNYVEVDCKYQIKVSELLKIIKSFKVDYLSKGIFPDFSNDLNLNLFNTFLCYLNYNMWFPFHLPQFKDERGAFVETVKLNSGGQISFSTTMPGITRGNHFHTRKTERFAVIKGKAKIELRRVGTDKVMIFELDGDNPSFVDMPVWHTHNITNIGNDELYTLFYINEKFDSNNPDTYYEVV